MQGAYSWQQQQGEYRAWQQAQEQKNQQWRESMQQYQQQLGAAGYQQADPNNAYQKYLQAQNFNSYFDPSSYQGLLAQQQATAGVHQQVAAQYSNAQQQQEAVHRQQYDAKLAAFLQQRGLSMEQYRAGQVYLDPQGNPQAVRSVQTAHGQVVAPDNYEQMLAQSVAAGQVPQFQRPPEIDFKKLSPEEFHEQTLYYRPSCAHCVNLLSHLARDPLLDSKITKINIDQYPVRGLVGVPTVVDERNQVWLGDDALRWVNAKATKDVIGMAVGDVEAAPTSELVPSGPGENFSFVHEALLNMPKVSSLYAIDTRQQRGPQIDQVMSALDQQRGQVLRPIGDPGNLTPVQHLELLQKQQGAPQGYGQPPSYAPQAHAPYQQQAHAPYQQPLQYQQPHASYQQPPPSYQPPPSPYVQHQQLPPYAPRSGAPPQFQVRGAAQAWPQAQQQAQQQAPRPGPMAPNTAAAQLFGRPEMNGSQKQVQNRSYEMDRAAFLGDQATLMSRRYQ